MWLIIQVVTAVSQPLSLPSWFETVVIVLLVIGFPVAVVLAWAFELTPEGIRLTQQHGATDPSGGHRMDYVLVAALAVVAVISLRGQLSSPVIDDPSIAVLPFEDMSPDGDQEYFGDGIAEELLNVLTRLDGLRVAGRTSSFAYKDKGDDLRTIGQALNVNAILEGSVRKDGNRIRVTAQLVKVADGYHLWSETFNRELTDIFAIQDEIAKAVAGALGVRLGVGNVNAFKGAGTTNVEAYEAYLKGSSRDSQDAKAFQFLETATRLDPNYAVAWAEIGIRIASTQWSSNPEDAQAILDRAYVHVLRATQLDPSSAESAAQLGTISYARFDWSGGEQAHAVAINLHADRLTLSQNGNLLMRAGRLADADAQLAAAIAADPVEGPITGFSWMLSLGRARFELAKQQLSSLYGGNMPVSYRLLIALNERNHDEVKALMAALPPPSDATRDLYIPVLRDIDSPETALSTLRAVHANDGVRWPSKLHDVAILAAYFGDAEFALELIGQEMRLTVIRAQALWYPVMSGVRQLPGFKDLVRDISLVPYWQEYGWADACRPLGTDDFSCE
jgi:TolB-like protein